MSDRNWQHFFGEARTRILLWYLLIISSVFVVGIPAFRYLLFQRVDERVRRDMIEELATFRALVSQGEQFAKNPESPLEDVAQFQSTILPSDRPIITLHSQKALDHFFDQYLRHRIPGDDTFLITFMDGKFFKSSPRARPQALTRDSELMQQWGSQTQRTEGVSAIKGTGNDTILYMLEPIWVEDTPRGVFVVAHMTMGERAEVLEALIVVMQVSLVLFVIALVLTWFAAGRVLAPLRTMTATVQTISETDLSQRLLVQGRGELATLAATFNNMMERLEAVFATQREFINDAGHELRTPITIIQGNLELLGDDPEEQQEMLSVVMGELERMGRMVNDMILLAKAERSDFLHLTQVNAAELTEELFTKAQALANRHWQVDAIAQGLIVVDRERITEAMMNLAQNATQYTHEGDTIAIGSTIAKKKSVFGFGIQVKAFLCRIKNAFLHDLPVPLIVVAA